MKILSLSGVYSLATIAEVLLPGGGFLEKTMRSRVSPLLTNIRYFCYPGFSSATDKTKATGGVINEFPAAIGL